MYIFLTVTNENCCVNFMYNHNKGYIYIYIRVVRKHLLKKIEISTPPPFF